MALKHLGANFDIHGGGMDLIFPHHENEIAQSEAATGVPFAHVWVHNGFVTLNREKMSKSAGNFFTLAEIFAKYPPSVVRYLLLSVHYRAPLDFSPDVLDQARQSLANLKDAIVRATAVLHHQIQGFDESEKAQPEVVAALDRLEGDYAEALRDDFKTPAALGVLHQMIHLLEKQFAVNVIPRESVRLILKRIRATAEVLGLDLFSFISDVLIPAEVTELCNLREQARQRKDWGEADQLRRQILERGYVVEDTPQGPRLLPRASA